MLFHGSFDFDSFCDFDLWAKGQAVGAFFHSTTFFSIFELCC